MAEGVINTEESGERQTSFQREMHGLAVRLDAVSQQRVKQGLGGSFCVAGKLTDPNGFFLILRSEIEGVTQQSTRSPLGAESVLSRPADFLSESVVEDSPGKVRAVVTPYGLFKMGGMSPDTFRVEKILQSATAGRLEGNNYGIELDEKGQPSLNLEGMRFGSYKMNGVLTHITEAEFMEALNRSIEESDKSEGMQRDRQTATVAQRFLTALLSNG